MLVHQRVGALTSCDLLSYTGAMIKWDWPRMTGDYRRRDCTPTGVWAAVFSNCPIMSYPFCACCLMLGVWTIGKHPLAPLGFALWGNCGQIWSLTRPRWCWLSAPRRRLAKLSSGWAPGQAESHPDSRSNNAIVAEIDTAKLQKFGHLQDMVLYL